MGEEPEAGLLRERTWAGAINRDSGNRHRKKAEALIRPVGEFSPGLEGGGRGR